MHPSENACNIFAFCLFNALDVSLYWFCAFFVQAHAVHTHRIQIADFLLYRAIRVRGAAQTLNQIMQLLLIVLAKHVKRAIARVLRLQRIQFLPSATCILIKIGARRNRLIQILSRHTSLRLTGIGAHHASQSQQHKTVL